MTGRAAQRRRLALLALLASARTRGLTRDKLVAFLWPDSNTERARHLLSDSVYRINQALGGEAILAVGDELRLNPERLPADAWEFADAIDAGEWEQAVELHAAPFLDGFFLTAADEFERWVESERARFAHERDHALEVLACDAEERDDPAAAVRWWRTLAAKDPFSSRVALRLMQALERAGDRAAAVQHARVHALLVRDQIGVDPDAEVERFAERLRTASTAAASADVGSAASSDAGAAGPVGASPTAGADEAAPFPPTPRPEPVHSIASSPNVPPGEAHGRPMRRRGSRAFITASVIAVAAILAIVALTRGNGAASGGEGATAVAVLPFADLSSGGDQEYFADGIAEELTARLSRVDGLRVVGRTSAFAFKGRAIDVREIGARLGVSAVLEGSVRKANNRLRIVAQLVDARDGYELWSETYEREAEDIFAIQDEISRAIVTRLRGRLAGNNAAPPTTSTTDDPETYNLYLRGRFEWHKRTESGLRAAADYFRRATEREPGYARAWVGLGDAYAVLGFYDYLQPDDAFPLAKAAAHRALELDPTIAQAHATLGYVALYHDWDWQQSEAEFRRTIELDPAYSTGHQWYANLLTAVGRFDEAIREMRTAQDLDPLSLIANAALGWVLFHARDYDSAVGQFGQTLELNPRFELAYLWRGITLSESGSPADAIPDLDRAVALSDSNAITIAALARARALAGDRDGARSLLAELESRGLHEYVPSYEIAKVHEALGDRVAALGWLERALAQRSHSMVFLAVDPQLRTMRGDAAFERLVREVGLIRRADPAERQGR